MINKSMVLMNRKIYGTKDSFSLLPISNDCPYIEALYDSQVKTLVIILKQKKQEFEVLPKLDEYGKPQIKGTKGTLMERKPLENFVEIQMYNSGDVDNFVQMFAVNADTFDYKSILFADEKAVA